MAAFVTLVCDKCGKEKDYTGRGYHEPILPPESHGDFKYTYAFKETKLLCNNCWTQLNKLLEDWGNSK